MVRNIILVLGLTVFSLIPLALPAAFAPDPERGALSLALGKAACLLVPAAALLACWRLFPDGIPARRRAALLLLFAILAALLTEIHRRGVDEGYYFGHTVISNDDWQEWLHERIVALDYHTAGTHACRFLPDAFARWTLWASGSFDWARGIYRHTFMLLLVYAIHAFARRCLDERGALAVVLVYGAIYPATIGAYAGQLVDPMSHLSFVLGFIFLHAGTTAFPYLLVTLVVGGLAKESVLVLAGFYLIFHRRDGPRAVLRAALVLAVAAAAFLGTRWIVIGKLIGYADMSQTSPSHISENLASSWGWPFFFSVGVLLPFVAIGWRRAALLPRRLVLFLLPVLLAASAVFSWLAEVRNLVPAIIPMAVIAVSGLPVLAGVDARGGPAGEPPSAAASP